MTSFFCCGSTGYFVLPVRKPARFLLRSGRPRSMAVIEYVKYNPVDGPSTIVPRQLSSARVIAIILSTNSTGGEPAESTRLPGKPWIDDKNALPGEFGIT